MRIIQTLTMLILFIAVCVSCNKEDDLSGVKAGEYNSKMIYQEFTPPLMLSFDSMENYYYGSTSIDINLDNKNDIVISQRLLFDFDPKDRHGFTDNNYPFTRVILEDGIDVVTKIHIVPMPRDESHVEIWVDTLSAENYINHRAEWSVPNSFFNMWCVSSSYYQGTFGTWYNVNNEERFIGIRMKIQSHDKYGWIKLSQQSRENIEILSCAIEK